MVLEVYGIKTCGSVKKALHFFHDRGIDVIFHDLKVSSVDENVILHWLLDTSLEKLFNTKGTTYKTLHLKDLYLNDDQKRQWMAQHNLLIKRPVVLRDNHVVAVGFDEELYHHLFD